MAELTIQLTDDQDRRLDELASEERRTKQQLVREAVDNYLKGTAVETNVYSDPYEPLMRIIGIGRSGKSDGSLKHDSIYHHDT